MITLWTLWTAVVLLTMAAPVLTHLALLRSGRPTPKWIALLADLAGRVNKWTAPVTGAGAAVPAAKALAVAAAFWGL